MAIPLGPLPASPPKLKVKPTQTQTQTQIESASASQLRSHHRPCPCLRRRRRLLIGSSSSLLVFPLTQTPKAQTSLTSGLSEMEMNEVMINKFHPSRPDWYQEFYAQALDQGMVAYEAEIAGYKTELFSHLVGKSKRVVELGIGTGPNFKYYVGAGDLDVIGVDPNIMMEKYARKAAIAAGLPPTNFSFMQGVGEALPLRDNSMDAVIGTLVLCSVKDVHIALKEVQRVLKPGGLYLFIEHVAASDRTLLRFWQSLLEPLQQLVSDGCHLTRETGNHISNFGFSSVVPFCWEPDLKIANYPRASLEIIEECIIYLFKMKVNLIGLKASFFEFQWFGLNQR